MIRSPTPGQPVRVWYNPKAAPRFPLHGAIGTVEIVSPGKPRNHGIRVGGTLYAVPAGNLQPVPAME